MYLVIAQELQIFLIYALYFIIWAVVWSFGLCYVMRSQKAFEWWKELFSSRSICDTCQKKLVRYELIPIVSRLVQKGKCRTCHTKLSLDYINAERITAAVFWMIGYYIFVLPAVAQLFLLSILTCFAIISIYDIYYQELDIKSFFVLLFLVVLGYAWLSHYPQTEELFLTFWWISTEYMLYGAFVVFLVRLVIWIFGFIAAKLKTKERQQGFGFGDVLMWGLLGGLIPLVYSYIFALQIVDSWQSHDLSSYLWFVLWFELYHILCSSILWIIGYFYFHKNSSSSDYLPFLPYMIIWFMIAAMIIAQRWTIFLA